MAEASVQEEMSQVLWADKGSAVLQEEREAVSMSERGTWVSMKGGAES